MKFCRFMKISSNIVPNILKTQLLTEIYHTTMSREIQAMETTV